MIAEHGHRIVEINKATYEFERDILRGAINSVSCTGLSPYVVSCRGQGK